MGTSLDCECKPQYPEKLPQKWTEHANCIQEWAKLEILFIYLFIYLIAIYLILEHNCHESSHDPLYLQVILQW